MAALASRSCGSFVVEFWTKSFRIHGTLSGTSSPVILTSQDYTRREAQDDLLSSPPLLLECTAREVDAVRELEHNDNAKITDERGFAKRSSHQENKRAAGTLGGYVVVGINGRFEGVEYRVGGGFTAAQRAEFWALRDEAVGHVVTVKYFARGVKEKPRHAQFKDFRPEFDR